MTWSPITTVLPSWCGAHVPDLTIADVDYFSKVQDCGQVCHFDDPSEFDAAIDEKTKAVYVETIGNPTSAKPDCDI